MVLRVAWRTRARVRVGAARTPRRIESVSPPKRSPPSQPATDADRWSPLEAELLAATDQLVDRYRVDDETWSLLAKQLDPRQLVELVFVVGTYTGLAMAFNSFGLQLDPDLRRRSHHRPFPKFEE